MTSETKIVVGDGKYTLLHTNGTNLRALRYDEPWRDLVGDGLFLSLAQHIEEMQASRENVIEELDCMNRNYQALILDYTKMKELNRQLKHEWKSVDMLYGVKEFMVQCADAAGTMVNGNSLSAHAQRVIDHSSKQKFEIDHVMLQCRNIGGDETDWFEIDDSELDNAHEEGFETRKLYTERIQ